jgi:hypothetical protein
MRAFCAFNSHAGDEPELVVVYLDANEDQHCPAYKPGEQGLRVCVFMVVRGGVNQGLESNLNPGHKP